MVEIKGKVFVRGCPCCGSRDLWVGVQSASSYGVKCDTCGLRMYENVPDKWPTGTWKKKDSVDDNLNRLHMWVLLRAVERWNKRVPAGWCDSMEEVEVGMGE